MTKQVKIGNLYIGGGNKIAIQSMTNVPLGNFEKSKQQMIALQQAGCDIVRFAVTDKESCKNIGNLKQFVTMPIVADIHFDASLAISAMENGVDKIRINPGNFPKDQLKKVIDSAKQHDVAIRIGVNGGSIEKSLNNLTHEEALFLSLKNQVEEIEKLGFYNLVLSAKSSSVLKTVKLARLLAKNFDYPLHIGVTEAGPLEQGAIFNAVGIGSLLVDGIGDTIRVSLTADPVKEVEVAKTILSATENGVGATFVSCPKCGRCAQDLEFYANSVYNFVKTLKKPIKVAVMGCEVNGPGECASADLGMACGKGKVAFFKKGQVYKIVDETDALQLFIQEIKDFDAD